MQFRSRELLRLVSWMIAVASLWLTLPGLDGSGHAQAQAPSRYGVVALDLRTDTGEVPTDLCVATKTHSARARETLASVLVAEPDVATSSASASPTTSWRVKPEVWGRGGGPAKVERCIDQPWGDCRPRVELPEGVTGEDLFVACTSDQGLGESEARPLFVLLEYLEGSPPQIQSVRLVGGVATVGVLGSNFDQVIVTARSIGGHYAPHQRSQRGTAETDLIEAESGRTSTKALTLELTSRCRTVEVRLPRTRLGPADRERLTVRVHGEPTRCVSNLVGSEVLQVRIPPAPLGVGSIDVDLAATKTGKAAARYGASYESTWPPKIPFALEFHQVTFRWRRPECIYPEDRCPEATLETGTTCSARVTTDGCDYTCPGTVTDRNAIALDLPLDVTFEKTDPRQRWTDKLAQNGQELSSYVPADQIYLTADIENWNESKEVPDNRITQLELFGEDGSARPYSIEELDRLLLRIPGATCERLSFRAVGSRVHQFGSAEVQRGKLLFGNNPHRRARIASFGFMALLGGGPVWSGQRPTPPLYFSGLGMAMVELRSRKPGWQRVGWEIRAGGTLGTWGKIDEDDDDADERIGWARILPFEPGALISLHERFGLGVGLGLGFSLPFRDDQELTGDRLNFIWSPNIDFRVRIARRWRAVMQFRGMFGEKAFIVTTASQAAADEAPTVLLSSHTGNASRMEDDRRNETARSLLFLFGVQASF